MTLKEEIRDYANSIGVPMVGFTGVEPLEDIRELLEKRRDLGYLSGFEEEDLELRLNPKKIMASVRSIIVIAVPYFVEDEQIDKKKIAKYHGELARVAWGQDYHRVLRRKMEMIAGHIKGKEKKLSYKILVDTGPLVDKHIAFYGGLGWYGYNSLLINEEYGSWFFIGSLLTNLDIPQDGPLEQKTCIGCGKCIEYCPTGAIEGPFIFNANKCLSNLLQQKTDLVMDYADKIGKNLYGCDICQEVCPHNRGISRSEGKEFVPREDLYKPNLLKLINISNREFNESYGKTSAGWRGKRVLQRNAIIALANHGDKDAIAYLLPMLEDERPEIRKYSLWAIYQLDASKAIGIFEKVKKYEKDGEIIRFINSYLNKEDNI